MEGVPKRELKNRRGATTCLDFLSPRCIGVVAEQNNDDGDKRGLSFPAAAIVFQDKENE
jgi:hypothetical protein